MDISFICVHCSEAFEGTAIKGSCSSCNEITSIEFQMHRLGDMSRDYLKAQRAIMRDFPKFEGNVSDFVQETLNNLAGSRAI